MLKFCLFLICAAMLTIMITVSVSLFYFAITEDEMQNYIYGAAVDLFTCMLIFRGDTHYVEVAYGVSLLAVAAVALCVCAYKKIKTPKEAQN